MCVCLLELPTIGSNPVVLHSSGRYSPYWTSASRPPFPFLFLDAEAGDNALKSSFIFKDAHIQGVCRCTRLKKPSNFACFSLIEAFKTVNEFSLFLRWQSLDAENGDDDDEEEEKKEKLEWSIKVVAEENEEGDLLLHH